MSIESLWSVSIKPRTGRWKLGEENGCSGDGDHEQNSSKVDGEQLLDSLEKGDLFHLENVTLKESVADLLNLPLDLVEGRIGTLKVTWATLTSIVVEVDQSWKMNGLPSDRTIKIFADQNSIEILSEFRKISQKLSTF